MAQDVELMQDKQSNACCAALHKKHTKLLEKYLKIEGLKNKFKECTALVKEKYDVIEKENESLKKALEEIKVQVNMWKDEKEKEAGRCIDLEDEVSALQDEIRLLKQNGNSTSQEADEQLQERLTVAEKEIKQLKELLDQERGRTALEKKNAELAKKKADEALKKVETGKNKVIEARKVANAERKKAEENRLLLEKLKKETDDMKSMLASEKSKFEAADKKVEAEKQKAVRERKRADLAMAKSEEQRELAETNLKNATFEKDRADDLNRKLEESRNRAKKLEEEMRKHKCSGKLVEAQADGSNAGNAELASDVFMGMLKNDARFSQWMEKMLLEKEHNIIREKKRADSEKKKAKEQRKVAEEHKKMAMEQKHRADQLSRESQSYKLRVEELQKELQLRNNNVTSETETVKLLKKQLELEKLLVKNAQKAAKVEAFRNKMLHQETCHLKQECLQFQQRLDILDKSFLLGCEGIDQVEKIGNQTLTREMLCSNGYHRQLISGTDSRMDPPYGGSNQKMLQSSAINSSSASFSDRPLVGSQERGTSSVMTSANMGEDRSNLEPKMARLSDKMRVRYTEHDVAKAHKSMRSPIKDSAKKKKIGHHEKKRILDAVVSIEKFYSKGQKLHQRVSEKLSLLHGILNRQKDEPEEQNPKETSLREPFRPRKKRKTSSEGTLVIHRVQKSGEPESMLVSDVDHPDACIPASSLRSDVMKSDLRFNVGMNNISGRDHASQDFDEIVAYDYMKLLDLDNAADENSYRRAIAMPLSPMLPEVEFHGDEKLEVDNSEMLVYQSSQEGLSRVRDNPASVSSFRAIESGEDGTNLLSNGLVPSRLQTEEDCADFSKNMETLSASDTHFHEIHVSRGKLGISDLSGSGNEETSILCKHGIGSSHGGLLKYFVVSSDNKENSSILRILQTIGSCMLKCSFLHSSEVFLRSILDFLWKVGDLSIKEKSCVFFSLILHEISEVGLKNLTNVLSDSVQTLGSATMHIKSAFSDPDFRRLFMESCDLFELLTVIEDFLLQRKLLVCGDVSDESEIHYTSKLNLILDGKAIVLSEVVASAHLLVAGASLLASLCSAVDHIGFVCEISSDIIRMQKSAPAVMLAVLHSFAHICGSKYLSLHKYSLAMTAVKSLVLFLEKQILLTDSTSSFPSEVENPSKTWVCSNCPFSEDAVPVEDVALLLLESLKQYHSESWAQDSLAFINLLVPKVRSHEGTEKVMGLREAIPLSSDENLCGFIDILSLVELLASIMSWDWTSDHLIGQICEYLESCLMEGFSAAITVLLGQLGRLGVGASGYEDSGVKKLRGWLSAFVCETTFMKLDLSVQFAIITSLLGLTPIKFEEIVEGKVSTPAVTSQSIPASFIKEWFSSLSHEQQSFLRLR